MLSKSKSLLTQTPRSKTDPLAGRQIGHYRLLRLIGEGRQAAVYAAHDQMLERTVAVKLLPRHAMPLLNETKQRQHFLREARAVASLDHENIVRVYEIGEDGGWLFIAMELVEGRNLLELICASTEFDTVRACQLIADIADALAYAHERGMLHRDIKPANLMVTRSGRCKLTDFGLARTSTQTYESDDALNTYRVGTPAYMAPELFQGRSTSQASDIYSLAATLWHVLTGVPPNRQQPGQATEVDREVCRAANLRAIRNDLPDELVQVLEHSLTIDPADRLDDAQALARTLRVCSIPTHDAPLTAQMQLTLDRLLRQRRTSPWRIVVFSFVLIVLAVALASGAVVGLYALEMNQRGSALLDLDEQQAAKLMRQFKPVDVIAGVDWASAVPVVLMRPWDVKEARQWLDQPSSAMVSLTGLVESIDQSANGRVCRVVFRNLSHETSGTIDVVYFQELMQPMAQVFGGDYGEGLAGQQVVLKGQLTQYQGRPQIIISSPQQLFVLANPPTEQP